MACEDCKVWYDLDKIYNAICLAPNILEMHKGHKVCIYSEHADECVEKYEYSKSYKEVEIWEKGNLKEEYRNMPLKWTYEEFNKRQGFNLLEG
jgi:hypothetical protein